MTTTVPHATTYWTLDDIKAANVAQGRATRLAAGNPVPSDA